MVADIFGASQLSSKQTTYWLYNLLHGDQRVYMTQGWSLCRGREFVVILKAMILIGVIYDILHMPSIPLRQDMIC